MGNEKALIWNTPSDYADGEPKPEMLCIRFGKAECKYQTNCFQFLE